MQDNFDSFPNNIGETSGVIPRHSFSFYYKRFEVWQGGASVYSDNSNGIIEAKLIDGKLNITIDDSKINPYIKPNFSFSEISTLLDRIMWSKDIFNRTGKIEKYNPDISSLFFKNGVLVKVTYTIHDPNILIAFYSSENDYYNMGLEAIRQNKFSVAINYFTSHINMHESNDAFYYRAYSYYNLGSNDLAQKDCEEAISITTKLLKNADKTDFDLIDGYFINLIRAKSKIAEICTKNNEFSETEFLYQEILGLYRFIKNVNSIPSDIPISQAYSNSAFVRFNLDKLEDAARDLAAAYVEAPDQEFKNEIIGIANSIGLTEMMKKCIPIYTLIYK